MNIQIESYYILPDIILVEGYEKKLENLDCIEAEISRYKFGLYLENNGYLEWVHDTADHNGEHVQTTGTLTREQFINTMDLTDAITNYLKIQS